MRSPRPAFIVGGYYHFYNRGAHRLSIFKEPENYLFVIRKLKRYCREFSLTVVAYCLMPNHYHFLVRQEAERPAGLLPQRIFNSYVKAYNKRYGHAGTMFEGHFHTKHIESYQHLLHLCCYIHANPVKDGFAAAPGDWQYSNYLEWVGEREGRLVDRDFIKENFGSGPEYRNFVLEYLLTRQLPDDIKIYIKSFES